MTQVAFDINFQVLTCWACGVSFAMPFQMYRRRCEDGEVFCCPARCRLTVGKSENTKLKEQLERKQKEVDRKQKEVEWARQDVKNELRSHAATKGQLTKATKRVQRTEAGVCTHCNRSFKQLRQHMKNKHPDCVPEPKKRKTKPAAKKK